MTTPPSQVAVAGDVVAAAAHGDGEPLARGRTHGGDDVGDAGAARDRAPGGGRCAPFQTRRAASYVRVARAVTSAAGERLAQLSHRSRR